MIPRPFSSGSGPVATETPANISPYSEAGKLGPDTLRYVADPNTMFSQVCYNWSAGDYVSRSDDAGRAIGSNQPFTVAFCVKVDVNSAGDYGDLIIGQDYNDFLLRVYHYRGPIYTIFSISLQGPHGTETIEIDCTPVRYGTSSYGMLIIRYDGAGTLDASFRRGGVSGTDADILTAQSTGVITGTNQTSSQIWLGDSTSLGAPIAFDGILWQFYYWDRRLSDADTTALLSSDKGTNDSICYAQQTVDGIANDYLVGYTLQEYMAQIVGAGDFTETDVSGNGYEGTAVSLSSRTTTGTINSLPTKCHNGYGVTYWYPKFGRWTEQTTLVDPEDPDIDSLNKFTIQQESFNFYPIYLDDVDGLGNPGIWFHQLISTTGSYFRTGDRMGDASLELFALCRLGLPGTNGAGSSGVAFHRSNSDSTFAGIWLNSAYSEFTYGWAPPGVFNTIGAQFGGPAPTGDFDPTNEHVWSMWTRASASGNMREKALCIDGKVVACANSNILTGAGYQLFGGSIATKVDQDAYVREIWAIGEPEVSGDRHREIAEFLKTNGGWPNEVEPGIPAYDADTDRCPDIQQFEADPSYLSNNIAFSSDGAATQLIQINGPNPINPPDFVNGFTVACRVKQNSLGSTGHLVGSWGATDQWRLHLNAGTLTFECIVPGPATFNITHAIADTDWHDVVVRASGGSVFLYVDGVIRDFTAAANPISSASAVVLLAEAGGVNISDASMSMLALYSSDIGNGAVADWASATAYDDRAASLNGALIWYDMYTTLSSGDSLPNRANPGTDDLDYFGAAPVLLVAGPDERTPQDGWPITEWRPVPHSLQQGTGWAWDAPADLSKCPIYVADANGNGDAAIVADASKEQHLRKDSQAAFPSSGTDEWWRSSTAYGGFAMAAIARFDGTPNDCCVLGSEVTNTQIGIDSSGNFICVNAGGTLPRGLPQSTYGPDDTEFLLEVHLGNNGWTRMLADGVPVASVSSQPSTGNRWIYLFAGDDGAGKYMSGHIRSMYMSLRSNFGKIDRIGIVKKLLDDNPTTFPAIVTDPPTWSGIRLYLSRKDDGFSTGTISPSIGADLQNGSDDTGPDSDDMVDGTTYYGSQVPDLVTPALNGYLEQKAATAGINIQEGTSVILIMAPYIWSTYADWYTWMDQYGLRTYINDRAGVTLGYWCSVQSYAGTNREGVGLSLNKNGGEAKVNFIHDAYVRGQNASPQFIMHIGTSTYSFEGAQVMVNDDLGDVIQSYFSSANSVQQTTGAVFDILVNGYSTSNWGPGGRYYMMMFFDRCLTYRERQRMKAWAQTEFGLIFNP